jgi:glycosyltransferase involved in cell wall biosynthesis
MRVVASVLWYPPHRYIGSELMTHQMLTRLVRRGHEVTVVTKDPVKPYVRDGVRVQSGSVPTGDVLVYHVDFPNLALVWQKPKVGIAHNTRLNVQAGLRSSLPDILTCNSFNSSKELPYHGRKLVVHPPVAVPKTPRRNAVRDHVTLINLESTSKVGPFWEVVRALPDQKFLGVRGGYGEQVVPTPLPPNATVIDQVSPRSMPKKVWDRTSILLVPSAQESWSMVASEAMAHGIPVIANRTNGLWENLRGVALWADRQNPQQWVDSIESVLGAWDEYSSASLERAKKQEATFDLEVEQWCDALEELC